jgi:hypothetical protein
LQGKDGPRRIDVDEPRVVRLAFKNDPPRSDLDEKIRRGSNKVDQTVERGVVRLEKKIEQGLKQVDDEIDRKKRKRSFFTQILISMGIKDNDPRRRKRVRVRRLNEAKASAPKPAVNVRVHPPPRSVTSEPSPPPPIVYAPPIRQEKYPPPGVGIPYYAKFPPPAVSMTSSQQVEMSGESDDDFFPNKRFKRKFRNDEDDDTIGKIHIVVKGDKQSEGKRTPHEDDADDDIVRKVHLARDPLPTQRRRRQRTGARVGQNRPIPVVF